MVRRFSSITQQMDQHGLRALKNAQKWRPFSVANGGVDHCQLNDTLQAEFAHTNGGFQCFWPYPMEIVFVDNR